MSSTIQTGGLSSWGQRYPIIVRNIAAEQAPAYAIMQVAGASAFGSTTVYDCTKPTGTAAAKYLINSPQLLLAVGGPTGAATNHYPIDALVAGTPSINQEIGPVNGSWLLSVNGKGFLYLGGLSTGIGRVASKAGTAAPGDDFPLVRIVNVSGVSRQFGNIVGYGPPTDPPPGTLYRIPTFQSAAPAAGQPFAVLLSDVAYNDTCDAGPVGVVACQINLTDATHGYADVVVGDYGKLASGGSGPARIVWREKQGIAGSGTLGVQWARVLLGPPATKLQFGEVYSTIAAMTTWGTPGTGLVKFKKDDGTDDGSPVPVENRYKFSYANGDTVLCDRAFTVPRVVGDKGDSSSGGGAFMAVLQGTIPAATTSASGNGTATIYAIEKGGGLTLQGTRKIHNLFPYPLPGGAAQYAATMTYRHKFSPVPGESEPPEDDEFTITGADVLALLASLQGFGPGKALYSDGSIFTAIKWGGKQCPTP